jgi:hypothetical protein
MSTINLIQRIALPVLAVVLIALAALGTHAPATRTVSDGGLPAGALAHLLDESQGVPVSELHFTYEQTAVNGR